MRLRPAWQQRVYNLPGVRGSDMRRVLKEHGRGRSVALCISSLCIAVCFALWVTSYFYQLNIFIHKSPIGYHMLEMSPGLVTVVDSDLGRIPTGCFYIRPISETMADGYKSGWWHFDWEADQYEWETTFPSWILLLLLIALPLTHIAFRLTRKPRLGDCYSCGYNLRGRSDAATCPECGEPINLTSAQAK